jgi:hypothetical protein
MQTKETIAKESAAVAFNAYLWVHYLGTTGAYFGGGIAAAFVVCTVLLWRGERGMRENARIGYHEGQRLLYWSRFRAEPQEVTYQRPSYSANVHVVRLMDSTYDRYVNTDELSVAPLPKMFA